MTTNQPGTQHFRVPPPAPRLSNGQPFPLMSAPLVNADRVTLPTDLTGRWGVLLFYRGDWCPYCRSQLKDFQQLLPHLEEQGATIVALSVDTLQDAQKTVQRHRLTFPTAYGLHAREIAAQIGAYTGERDVEYLQSTNFVLNPDGSVALALYSSGAVGRLSADDTLKFIKYLRR